MKLFIAADLVPTDINYDVFTAGDATALVGEKVKKIMDSCDYRIFNLELALTDKDTPIKKAGPNIGAPTSTINGFKALGVDLWVFLITTF
jgi:poly-gamma-glutamate synthesis protein (capsule biosynthesis protein)